MSEYWKSIPRKFCEACKCWFADNRASIEFHERGKRHQDSVKRRLERLCRKGEKDYIAKQKYERQMQKIEKDALVAYHKDITNTVSASVGGAAETSQVDISTALERVSNLAHKADLSSKTKQDRFDPADSTVSYISKHIPKAKGVKPKVWHEASAGIGVRYYWNSETGVTQWDEPEEYISLAEKERQEKEFEIARSKALEDYVPEECLQEEFGPDTRRDPYGKWTTVVVKKEEVVDWQLPVQNEDDAQEATITLTAEDKPKNKFKEKTVSTLDEHSMVKREDQEVVELVEFRKRKNVLAKGRNRNVRQRIKEEDDE